MTNAWSSEIGSSGRQTRRAVLLLAAATIGLSGQVQAGRGRVRISKNPPIPPDEAILPSETDREIRTFDFRQYIYRPRGNVRNQLAIMLPGTNGEGRGLLRVCVNAAVMGYHVIIPMYPNDVAAAVCRNDEDPDAFEKFRLAIIEGGTSPYLKEGIARSESIENRIVKLLRYLGSRHSDQGWGQYLRGDNIVWEKIAIGGGSQGGGHAALIATKYPVARVLCFGAPKDYSTRLRAPAAWYRKSVTPPSRFFAFNNTHDRQGCSYEQQVENLRALGIADGIANVDTDGPPYRHARALFTSWPGPESSIESLPAHTSVIDDEPWRDNGPIFRPVWRYMFTEPTP
ncbi:MAG TPA: hypothetical protein VN685_01235 [Rhizomicrobium sp.]|nr:hypothetical protein [Rhizomicrobium sp.]